MVIQFQIEYKTWFGQQMMITGSLPVLGNHNREPAVPMQYVPDSNGLWRLEIETDGTAEFDYRYFLLEHGTETDEWGENRVCRPDSKSRGKILLKDHWRTPSNPALALLTSAFTKAIFRPGIPALEAEKRKTKTAQGILVRFKPLVSRIKEGQQVAVAGSCGPLGGWDAGKALLLGNQNFPEWKGEVTIPRSEFPFYYKYLVIDTKENGLSWEKSENRLLELTEGELPGVIEIRDEMPVDPGPPWKGAGTAIPVFSLRRESGMGVGEFTDLKLMTDWAIRAGLKMIQILPVNDSIANHTWKDSYPYAAISVFALHPVYINLREMGILRSKTTQKIIEEQGNSLNKLEKIDFEAVMILKSRFFKLIYDEKKEEFLKDPAFLGFFEEHKQWLKPYAAFSYLRDLFHTPDFSIWGEFARFTPDILDHVTDPSAPHFDDIAVHYFIQYHAHRQLSESAAYARSKGVVLKGDLPIGIYRFSVDAWVIPELYHMECQAGAPPDDFSATGQNWRFPTYNWEVMALDNYAWWQQRLRHMSGYFDAFRIDHILGFFRIWEIPSDQVQGLMGYFNPSIPYTRNEILSKGIHFDEYRYCKPYIREHVLVDYFGEEKEYARNNFLKEYAPGCFELYPEVDTQQKVEKRFTPDEDTGAEERNRMERLRNGFYALIAEVLFIEKSEGKDQVYFPRNSFHSTFSFRELDYEERQKLDELYIDYFYRRNEDFWREKAMTRLPAVKNATNMLLCGEDLGMVPACVPGVMNELGILSLEVQRMPKDPKIEFGMPDKYPWLSVATPSSHDTSTIRGWWEEDRNKTRQFYNQILGKYGVVPDTCTPEMVREIIVQHLWSPSMWTVFPVQDLLGMDEQLRLPDPRAERINEPGNPNHYWRFRMHLSLENLIHQDGFNEMIHSLIKESGRG